MIPISEARRDVAPCIKPRPDLLQIERRLDALRVELLQLQFFSGRFPSHRNILRLA
jgi:hypothetical protein